VRTSSYSLGPILRMETAYNQYNVLHCTDRAFVIMLHVITSLRAAV